MRPRTLHHPLVWALGFLVMANVVASVMPTWRVEHASVSPVNLRGRRAYPEYVAALPGDAERDLTVLISNSQAAYDGVDATTLYPALLRPRLDGRFENWSADGIRIVEAELLTRQALARNAKTIVVALGVSNIDVPQQATLDVGNTDADLLVGDGHVWASLGDSVTTAKLERDAFAQRLLAFYVPLVRLRLAGQDWASEHIPSDLHAPLFGRTLQHPTRIVKIGGSRGSAGGRPQRGAERYVSDAQLAPRLATLERFATRLQREAARRGTQVIWCWVPVALDRLHPQLRAEGLAFYDRATPLLQANGFRVHDLTAAIPDDEFLDATHLTREGHMRMSELMGAALGEEARH